MRKPPRHVSDLCLILAVCGAACNGARSNNGAGGIGAGGDQAGGSSTNGLGGASGVIGLGGNSATGGTGSGGAPTGGSSGGGGRGVGGGAGGTGGAPVVYDGPPMGFNPYNNQWCNTTEAQMHAFTDAMVTKGLLAAGYKYVNLDCAWQGSRDANGVIQSGSLFPSGIKALSDYVHGKGLKLGIYTAPGTTTCDNKPGSQGHEIQDVNTYASWGVDYIKLDWCGADYSATGAANIAQTWKSAIAASGRPMVLSINAGASASVGPWAEARVNLWRVGDDICDTWLNKTGARTPGYAHCTSTTVQSGIYDYLTMNLDYLGPLSASGHWGDPDMLQVGNPGLSLDESRTHFSIWAMWSAPLIAGNDLTKMNGSDIASQVLLNTEVIAIDQDPANNWATRVKTTSSVQVYKKALASPGTYAIALVNLGNSAADITVAWSELGLTTVAAIRDLWAHRDIASSSAGYTATAVPPHGTVMLKVTGE